MVIYTHSSEWQHGALARVALSCRALFSSGKLS